MFIFYYEFPSFFQLSCQQKCMFLMSISISYLKNHPKHKCICYTYQHCYGNLIEWKNLKSVLMTP